MWKAYVKALGKQEKLEKDKKNLMKSTEQRYSLQPNVLFSLALCTLILLLIAKDKHPHFLL